MTMENKKKTNAPVVRILSVAMAVIGVVACVFAVRLQKQQQPFGLGDYSDADVAALEESFDRSGSDKDLVELLKALCYQAEVADNHSMDGDIAKYGSELLSRAKAGETDLSLLDEETVMLELIGLIKEYGAA